VPPGRTLRVRVSSEVAGLRLDQALARLLPDTSRAEARRLIARGSVFLAKSRVKVAGRIVRAEQTIEVHLAPPHVPSGPEKAPPQIPILLLTADVVVVDKPSGLLSAPTPETDQADLLHFLGKTVGPLFLVHRLDAQTSGALLVARTKAAARALSEQLDQRSLGRTYVALLAGSVAADFSQDTAVAGRPARTHFRVLERAPAATRVEAQLETGRTHQIRIHAQAAGHPILGDRRYGGPGQADLPTAPRLALHAAELHFQDPTTGQPHRVEAPFPPELAAYWASLC